ncbi:hypothetical protein [Blastopirellula retiformator]|uniref:Uncharacterized protein n=1 Tax=Blastopirellula retiformator TaxID=2527970 RepID=A0A5C5UWQ2_9BACT|nr:hypothetical protein [Blastopirellula retiformator]TWT29987.1 hypothetical protein Enr8_46440 [Blastopirellula retiformator]
MAIYSTYFLCKPNELPAAFPGWKPPLPDPVVRTQINPYTREAHTVTSQEPDWDDFDPDLVDQQSPQVVAIEGDFQSYLESRLPSVVRALPHRCSKGLTNCELEPLVAADLGELEVELEIPLYAHPLFSACLNQFPARFVDHLRTADEPELGDLAQAWAARMSTPDYTHNVDGERLYDDWDPADARRLMTPIVELAVECAAGQSLYLMNEW